MFFEKLFGIYIHKSDQLVELQTSEARLWDKNEKTEFHSCIFVGEDNVSTDV